LAPEVAALAAGPLAEAAAEARRIEASHDHGNDPAGPGRCLVELVGAFGKLGVLRLCARRENGGTYPAVRPTALCVARERLGHESPLADLAFAMQGLGSLAITQRGETALRARWIPRVVSGEVVAAFALTEAEAGSDLGGIATTARRDGDGYVLDGEKIFISNAGVAGLYTTFAVTGEGKRRLSAFAVPAETPGITTTPLQVLGGHPIGTVRFAGARIPADALIGAEGDGLGIALGVLHSFRPTVGAAAVGFAQRALDETVAHVTRRVQFGQPLAAQQAVQMAVADMACEIDAARLLVHRAAATAEAGADRSEVARTGSMAKLVATENAQRVIDRAVQLHGGRGVLARSIVARLYEDVRSLRIYEGASDVQRLLIAREILGR
jgi:acyl-CoA dehydrogenase